MTLHAAITLARSAAEFPTSSLIFVAACSSDWLPGFPDTELATGRANVNLNGILVTIGLPKFRIPMIFVLSAILRISGRPKKFMFRS